MIPKQPIAVRFGKLEQGRSPRNTMLGSLTEAINVRQRKLGRYSKRYGSTPLNTTTDTGTISSGTGLASTADALILHAGDSIYARDTVSSTWKSRGSQPRVHPTDTLGIDQYGDFPFAVTTGTKVYLFTYDDVNYYYRVIERDTGLELKARTKITLAATIHRIRPIVAGGYVWLFYQSGGGAATIVNTAKFDPSNLSAAPTTAVFLDPNGTGGTCVWDVVSTVNGVAFVGQWAAVCQPTGAGVSRLTWKALLDTSTGQPAASPGLVGDTHGLTGAGAGNATGPIAWLSYDGTNGSLYFMIDTRAGTPSIALISISASTLASPSTIWSDSGLGTGGGAYQSFCGYVVSSSEIYVFHSYGTEGAGSVTEASLEDAYIQRYYWNGSSNTTTVWKRGAWAATHPFQVGSTWYIVTGYDDADNLQRCYDFRNASTGAIVGGGFYGRGGKGFMHGTSGVGTLDMRHIQFHTAANVSGNKVYVALQQFDGGRFYQARYVTWDLADSYGPLKSFVNDRQVWMPGPWPSRISGRDTALTEAVPMMVPPTPTLTTPAGGALTAGTYGVKHTYAWPDNHGNWYRSGESVAASTTAAANDQVESVVRTLRRTNGTAWIETWMTAANGSTYFLVARTLNDPTSATVTVAVTQNPATGAEALYADGGVLSNEPVPPHRAAFEWKGRLWLVDTDFEGEAWHSKEFTAEVGAEFVSVLKLTLYGGRGRVRAGGAISHDYGVLFKSNAVFALSGQGPDDTGAGGSFVIHELSYRTGCERPASVVTYPGGCLYQGVDGLIHRIGVDLQGSALADSDDYVSGFTVQAAIHHPKEREVRFYLSNGKIAVYDYGNANEQAPDGYWYEDEGSFTASVGACVHNDVPSFVESADGQVWQEVADQYYDNTTTQILPKCKLHPLQFADLGGEYRISRVQFVGYFASAHTLQMTVTPDGGSAQTYSKAVTAGPERFECRPQNCGRVGEVEVTVEQTGTDTGEGFRFDGLMFEVQPRGRAKRVNSTQRV